MNTIPLNEPGNSNVLWTAALTLFSALLLGGVFFVGQHQPMISLQPNFVEETDVQESWAAGGNTLRQVGFLTLGAIGLLGILAGKAWAIRFDRVILLGFCYVVWAGLSILWSIDPDTTIRRYVVMLCCVSGAFGIGRLLPPKQLLLAGLIVFGGYLLLGLGVEVALGTFQPLNSEYRFAGTTHPNAQAAFLALACLTCFVLALEIPKGRWLWGIVFVISFGFLLLTKSRTPVAAMLSAGLVMWLVASPPKRTLLLLLGGLWVGSVVSFGFLASGFNPLREYSEILLMGREHQAASLTGRLPLWADLWHYVQGRPWYGYGYESFWTPRHIYEISSSQEWTVSEAHSSYMSGLLQLGLVGLVLLLFTALSAAARSAMAFRQSKQAVHLFIAGGIVFCLLRGFSETGMGSFTAVTMLLTATAISTYSLAAERSNIGIEITPRTDCQSIPSTT